MEPYRRRPVSPTVCWLTPEGDAVSEHGELLDLNDWPKGHRLWCSYETAFDNVRAGKGEALCWELEEIRWRHRRFEDGWVRRGSDAIVIRLPGLNDRPANEVLHGLVAWRDWLDSFGACATGSSGSSAYSLLRARLERKLCTGSGDRPPIGWTLGGRQTCGPRGPGLYTGSLVHLDMPAAYASTLAGLRYGGVWAEIEKHLLDRVAGSDHPVFVHAKLKVPDVAFGPVQKRGRRPRSRSESLQLPPDYPTGGSVQGVWTWEEIQAGLEHGCQLQRLLRAWVHHSGWHPFKPWWEAGLEGRRMPGLAGQLAKITLNALVGRFMMDAASGVRTIRSGKARELISRPLVSGPQMWPAHDLAETVTGRVRARLYHLMMEAQDGLISAHTDGAWLYETAGAGEAGASHEADRATAEGDSGTSRVHVADPESSSARRSARNTEQGVVESSSYSDWRDDKRASRLELLNPQKLRYWRNPLPPWGPDTVYAGMPAERAEAAFQQEWDRVFAA